jgi:hypothetical protein
MTLRMLCLLALAALWLALGAAAAVTATTRATAARLCALESYGTDVDIARCYTDRGLKPPGNFDARNEE